MNIVRENRQGGTAEIRVTVGTGDYGDAVEKTLREYKRKANIPGFRPGMVPMGIINKMYRKGVVAEEAYKSASKGAFDYIEAEKIEYVGDVLPSESQQELDFENSSDHEFIFEIGLAPQVDIDLSQKDKVTKYLITVDDKMREGYRSNFLRRFGKLVDMEEVASDEALEVTLNNGQIDIADAYLGLISMEEEERKPFIGKKKGDTMKVDINDLYKSPAQRASILHVKEEELEGIEPIFDLTITRIRKFAEPELNEEFFKEAFPGGEVTDKKGFDAYIDGKISEDLGRESDYIVNFEVRRLLMDKAALDMPEAFLKRWLYVINEGKFPMEQIEADFPSFLDMMRWNLIQKYFAEKFDIKLSEEEALEEAKTMARLQFAQYGMADVADDMLTNYAHQILSSKDEARKVQERLFEKKIIEAVLPQLKVTEKKVTAEQFNKQAEEIVKQ
ncbi:MAG: trigger factor [Rikenellaceae bacterium]|nr:trigger factor [Rikenellaceae bacterium]